MKAPHILLAKHNIYSIVANTENIIGADAKQLLLDEVTNNAKLMFKLGLEHYAFSRSVARGKNWRQCISRAYYACYNISRAVRFLTTGEYDTTPDDHKKSQVFPVELNNREIHTNKIASLRSDRNLCDYDHTAQEADLLLTKAEALQAVEDMIRDARSYMLSKGVTV